MAFTGVAVGAAVAVAVGAAVAVGVGAALAVGVGLALTAPLVGTSLTAPPVTTPLTAPPVAALYSVILVSLFVPPCSTLAALVLSGAVASIEKARNPAIIFVILFNFYPPFQKGCFLLSFHNFSSMVHYKNLICQQCQRYFHKIFICPPHHYRLY